MTAGCGGRRSIPTGLLRQADIESSGPRATLDAIAESGNPRSRGKPLRHELFGPWRYPIGNYRVLMELRDNDLVILALDVDHHPTVYNRHRAR